MPLNISKKKDESIGSYAAKEGEERDVQEHLRKRIPVLKDSKKNILSTSSNINFEDIMKAADKEYQPDALSSKSAGRTILVQDEVKGIRGSRIVSIGNNEGEEWRSNISEPTLMVKIQTALSILVDQNPEAIFKATTDKYKATTDLAYSLWKRSWQIGRSKNQLKLFIFDLAKYGWAIARTYPRLVKRKAEILVELDMEHPEKNKYKEVEIVEYNDVYREKLDPYRTWIDDKTNLTDQWSMDDWYFEKDYSQDDFEREFGIYENAKYAKFGTLTTSDDTETPNNETLHRDDMITVGFYESKNKDLYAIVLPNQGHLPVYYSPLPNDDKKLSCWQSYWNERDPRTPYGIGLYEILKNNKVLYDRFENMTMDQLTMAIYPMLFYSGSNQLAGDGDQAISPGVLKQKLPGTTVEQINIKYDSRGPDGIKFLSERMDENTGISPLLQGQVEGKTLGEVLHAKDAALKRLNIPLLNISHALEDDAYIALSWMNQIYSVPEVREFSDQQELQAYITETGQEPFEVSRPPEGQEGTIKADFYQTLDLGMENRDGELIESPESRFFRLGHDLPTAKIKWEGRIIIEPQSIVVKSQELDRQRKLELFNLIFPATQLISQLMMSSPVQAVGIAKPVVQILEAENEKPENWLPDELVKMINDPAYLKMVQDKIAVQQQEMETGGELFTDPNAPKDAMGGSGVPQAPSESGPKAEKVVPKSFTSNPVKKLMGEISKPRV